MFIFYNLLSQYFIDKCMLTIHRTANLLYLILIIKGHGLNVMNNNNKSFKNIIKSLIALGIVALSSFLGINVYENTQEPSNDYVIELTNPATHSADSASKVDGSDVITDSDVNTSSDAITDSNVITSSDEIIDYAEGTSLSFANEKALNEHYEKHGIEMGFKSAKEYEHAAANVVMNPNSLFKTEKEDGDEVYYLEATNEFVIVAKNTGYIRTYFNPSNGIKYFNKQ